MLLKNIGMALKGMVIGLSMLIPGVSGGTMAVIMGIYDTLVESIGSFYKHFKKSLLALLPIGIGAVLGLLVFTRPVAFLFENYNAPTMFLFIGAVIGGVPYVYKQTGLTPKKTHLPQFALFLAGIAVVVAITFLPKDSFSISTDNSVANFFILLLAGVISSTAFVLPGISGSYVLLLLGMYGTVVRALSEMNIPMLIPFAVGVVIGLVSIARFMQHMLKTRHDGTFIVILGFIAASVAELFMEVSYSNINWLLCLLTFFVGFFAVLFLSKFDKSNQEN